MRSSYYRNRYTTNADLLKRHMWALDVARRDGDVVEGDAVCWLHCHDYLTFARRFNGYSWWKLTDKGRAALEAHR